VFLDGRAATVRCLAADRLMITHEWEGTGEFTVYDIVLRHE